MADALAEDTDAMQSPNRIAEACIHLSIVRPGNSGQDDEAQAERPQRMHRLMCLQVDIAMCALILRMHTYAPEQVTCMHSPTYVSRHVTIGDYTLRHAARDARWAGQLKTAGSIVALQPLYGTDNWAQCLLHSACCTQPVITLSTSCCFLGCCLLKLQHHLLPFCLKCV